jgi:propionaldehyde dehydrogenase
MEITEQAVRDIVARVVRGLTEAGAAPREGAARGAAAEPMIGEGIFPDVESAIAAARVAFQELGARGLETRRAMIAAMRAAVMEHLEEIARRAVEETGMGRVDDKKVKNRVAALMTPGVEDVQPVVHTDDHGLTLTERAPFGVIGAIAPSTNPTETIINNCIAMIAAGNSVVFNSHPAAKAVSAYTIAFLNRAIVAAGGPPNVISAVTEPTIETAQALFKHRGIALIVVTGGPAVVRAAMGSGKRVIAAGPGNPPVVVDETADIAKAGRDIVAGASLDNNIICIDEKEVLAVDSIADRLGEEMRKAGAHMLDRGQVDRLTPLIIPDPGRPGHEGAANKRLIGRNASVIAKEIGLDLPESTRLLLCEVEQDHPLVWTEQLMPVLPIVRMRNVDEAIDLAVACEHGYRHTAVMHSHNLDKLSRMAKVMNCSLFVKNGSAFNGLGYGGAGYTAWTIASPTGEGMTRASTFTRERRCSLIDHFRIV